MFWAQWTKRRVTDNQFSILIFRKNKNKWINNKEKYLKPIVPCAGGATCQANCKLRLHVKWRIAWWQGQWDPRRSIVHCPSSTQWRFSSLGNDAVPWTMDPVGFLDMIWLAIATRLGLSLNAHTFFYFLMEKNTFSCFFFFFGRLLRSFIVWTAGKVLFEWLESVQVRKNIAVM